MGVVHEHEHDGGSNAALLAMFLIAIVIIVAILVYGFTLGHWFTAVIVTSPGSGPGGASAAPSIAASVTPTH